MHGTLGAHPDSSAPEDRRPTEVRVLRDWRSHPDAEPETVLALNRSELRDLLGLRSDEATKEAVERLAGAGHLLPDVDRPDRWIPKRGGGRERMLVFRGTTDKLMVRRWHRGLKWDERHPAPPGTRWSDPTRY